MSQGRNEDWEIRKAILIRSIFPKIPYRVLSASSETSGGDYPESSSYDAVNASESQSVASIETPELEAPEVPCINDQITRPDSPLPELIIEREPDKHDEPVEYYHRLLIKIRKVFRKIYIEKKNMSDDDFFTDVEEYIERGDAEIYLYRKEISISSDNCCDNLNGYSADYESFHEADRREITNYGIVQYDDKNSSSQKSTEVPASNRNEQNNDKLQINISRNLCDSNLWSGNVEERELRVENSKVTENAENSDYRQITTQALVHTDTLRSPVCRETTKSPILMNRNIICSQTQIGLVAEQNEAAYLHERVTSSVSEKAFSHAAADDARDISQSSMYSFLAAERDAAVVEHDSEYIEAVRNVQREVSIASIQMDNARLTSDMDITGSPRLSIQNYRQNTSRCHEENPAEVTCDNNIVIINELRNITNTRSSRESANGNRNQRKRRQQEICEEIGIDWNKLRHIFVREPKMFKLCSCIGPEHICIN